MPDLRSLLPTHVISDYLERRLTTARALLKAIQRGERSAGGITSAANGTPLVTPTNSALILPPVNVAGQRGSARATPVPALRKSHEENIDVEDEYWDDVDDVPIDIPGDGPLPAVLTPATPPATQVRPPAPASRAPAATNVSAAVTPALEAKPYYQKVKKTLTDVFGLQSFRKLQLEAICEVMDGRDSFVLFPTGSGKSLTFQLPAVCQDGMTVVVCPLISLMTNQYDALKKRGIDVEQLQGESGGVWQRLSSGRPPKLLYLTPEMLQMSGKMQRVLTDLQRQNKLRRFVIDEAHLITDWGRTFRDSYKHLSQLKELYPDVPITALTATANAAIRHDIISKLSLSIARPLKLSFNRPNLDYEVRPKKKGKSAVNEMASFILEHHPRDTGIIYCSSRARCEELAKALRDGHKLVARHYHANMNEHDKKRVQEEWSRGVVPIIVATIAFGLGVDKPDVRYVLHDELPSSLQAYYQETGRAGRDGKLAHCILYYSPADFYKRRDRIWREVREKKQQQELGKWQEDDLRKVMSYCSDDVRCRRQQVLNYFGDEFDPADCKKLCNNCRNATPFSVEDHTENAKHAVRLLEAADRISSSLTTGQLAAALRGSMSKEIKEKNIASLPSFGACRGVQAHVLDRLIAEMSYTGILTSRSEQNRNGWSIAYLEVSISWGVGVHSLALIPSFQLTSPWQLDSGARALLAGQRRVELTLRVKAAAEKPRSKAAHAVREYAYNLPNAGPSPSTVPSAGPSTSSDGGASSSRSRRAAAAPLPPPPPLIEEERSLYRDDDPEEDEIEFCEDEIEDVSSPPPPPRRMGTRGMPSASQSMADGYDSEIEEIDAPYRVTLIEKDDLEVGDSDDIFVQCHRELNALRAQLSQGDEGGLSELLSDEAISMLALLLPNDIDSLRNILHDVGVSFDLVKPYSLKILDICTRYHMRR
ncbi:P-loop containing nucleoside triphosphate hydrolase protein [Trametes polyzona]|nr:P-loop containing nucleoside triphosphate hydrolase protein [Trametes polyzona]